MRRALARFLRGEAGALSVEAALMTPILLTVYAASFVWFDLFAEKTLAVRSTYTIADLLSRETDLVDADYIDGMAAVFDAMVTTGEETAIRVTYVRCASGCDGASRELVSEWSHATDTRSGLEDADLAGLDARIPRISNGEVSLLVETFAPYRPAFDVGLAPGTFTSVATVRPRFAPQMKWAGSS